jgi:hypothetical protein
VFDHGSDDMAGIADIDHERWPILVEGTELDALPPPCDRDRVFEGCSAVGRLVLDYAWLREKARALRAID